MKKMAFRERLKDFALVFVAASAAMVASCGKEPEAKQAPQVQTPQTSATVSPEEAREIDGMIAAAEGVVQGLTEIEPIRPRTPEFLQLKVDWQRKLLDAQLLKVKNADVRKGAIAEYVKQVRAVADAIWARREIDATKATIAMSKFAVAEGEYLLADAGGDQGGRKAALAAMSRAANEAIEGLLNIENIRPRTPEFFELCSEWLYILGDAALRAATTPEERKTALEGYAQRVEERSEYLQNARSEGGGMFLYGQELSLRVKYLVAREGGVTKEAELKVVLGELVKHSSEMKKYIEEIKNIRPRSPEFIATHIQLLRRALEYSLELNPAVVERQKAMDTYIAEVEMIVKELNLRTHVDVRKAQEQMGNYALAEARYLKATLR